MSLPGFSAWALINIFVPVFVPIVLLTLLKVVPSYRAASRGILTGALKDGQLFWTVIPMAAAACYEAGVAVSERPGAIVVAWLSLIYHVAVIVGSAVLVMLGTAASISESQQPKGSPVPHERNLLLLVSIWATGLTMLTVAATHFGFA